MFFRSYTDRETKNASREELFGKPEDIKGNKVDSDGLVKPGVMVAERDNIICKISNEKEVKATHTSVRFEEDGVVDKVLLSTNKDGTRLAKVRIRNMRTPQIGDKVSSRHGQKGTCGLTLRQEDMPFTQDGIVPDIIVNSHALPSRMTIAQLLECLGGKVAAMTGQRLDATPFNGTSVDEIAENLHKQGFGRYGKEVLYDGMTGKPLDARVFIGPTFYQRLKHMVEDKAHARSRGPTQLLVRQPVEGRGRGGGLRWGEMEKDCGVVHGLSCMLQERLCKVSDEFKTEVCSSCGIIGSLVKTDNTFECIKCGASSYKKITIPYAYKLLCQEMLAMNVNIKANI